MSDKIRFSSNEYLWSGQQANPAVIGAIELAKSEAELALDALREHVAHLGEDTVVRVYVGGDTPPAAAAHGDFWWGPTRSVRVAPHGNFSLVNNFANQYPLAEQMNDFYVENGNVVPGLMEDGVQEVRYMQTSSGEFRAGFQVPRLSGGFVTFAFRSTQASGLRSFHLRAIGWGVDRRVVLDMADQWQTVTIDIPTNPTQHQPWTVYLTPADSNSAPGDVVFIKEISTGPRFYFNGSMPASSWVGTPGRSASTYAPVWEYSPALVLISKLLDQPSYADGFVDIYLTTDQPVFPELGDLWYNTLALARWDGTTWVQIATHGPPAIEERINDAINQVQDMAGFVSAAQQWIADTGATLETLLGGPNVIPGAVINHLWTNVIRSRQITTDMLLVGSGDNYVPDAYFRSAELNTARIAASTGIWYLMTEETGENAFTVIGGAARTLRLITAPGSNLERSHPVIPGHTYRIRYDYRMIPSKDSTLAPDVRPVVFSVSNTGTLTTHYPRASYVKAASNWATDEVMWTAPEGAIAAYMGVVSNGGGASVQGQVRRPQFTSAINPSLLVDGTLRANLDIAAGGQVTAGDMATDGQAFMTGGLTGGIGFRVPAEDGVTPITVAQMGRDWISRNSTGDSTISMTGEDGAFAAQVGDFGQLFVGGRNVSDELENISNLVVHDDPGFASRGPYGDNQVGYRSVGFSSKAGHIYEIDARVHIVNESGSPKTHITYLRMQHGSEGNTSVQATISSPELASDDSTISNNAEGRFRMTGTFTHPDAREVRLLISCRNTGSGGNWRFARSVITVKDLGRYEPQVTTGQWSLGGGITAPGAPPTPPPVESPPQKYTRWFDFEWFQVFQYTGRSNPAVGGLGTRIRQGRVGQISASFPYGALLRIPDVARTYVMGATRIKAWVQLTNIGYVDGQVIAGQAINTTNPTQFPTPIGPTAVGNLPRGATRLLRLPDAWESRWRAGTNRSLTLGRVDSTGNNDRLLDFRNLNGDITTKARIYFEWEV